MSIGTQIKNERLRKGYTLEELAKQVGTSKQTIQRYETGTISNIPSDKIEAIAVALGVSPAYLMGWEDKKTEPTVKDDKLTESQRLLIEFAKTVPEDKIDLLLKVMRSIVEDD